MIYIMKNKKVDTIHDEYILIDNDECIQTRINAKPINANRLKKMFDMEKISAHEAWSMLSFKEVKSGMFFPLPF